MIHKLSKQNNGNRQRKQLESCHLMIPPDIMIQRFVWPHSNPGRDVRRDVNCIFDNSDALGRAAAQPRRGGFSAARPLATVSNSGQSM